ncbi:head maturation protease, ClpP-related [Rossellomorea sp. DA94]|uniref:head maturation protease, ClpP-related n=1 Tax=Rossellomorea sp. DA94 TaxID=3038653 RepID=UPI00244BEA65|nr:head maturation protease, ClpP-related [Rossellomorea sp. DA94]WGG47680.1 Clp protease ClpP [Rossellomorea sp. DA94]
MDWMKVKNQSDNSADLYFYGDIVSDWYGAWDDSDQYPENIRNFLDGVKGKDLNIYINSGGGSVFAGIAIYNMLKRHQGHKRVIVDGLSASIASVIMLAGDEVVVPSNAFVMIHKPWNGMMGNSNDFRKMADDLDAIEEGIINVYAENLKDGVDIETVRQMVQDETWLNGKEAANYFNITVGEENKAVAYVSDKLNEFKNTPQSVLEQEKEAEKQEEDRLIQNKIKALELELELI